MRESQDALDWSARTPLAEGLKHTIAYFDDLLTTTARGDSDAQPQLELSTA